MMAERVPATKRARDAAAPTVVSRRRMRSSEGGQASRGLRPSQVPVGPRDVAPRRRLVTDNNALEREAVAVGDRVRAGDTRVSVAGTSSRDAGNRAVGEAPAIVDEVLRSPGSPLGNRARALMESRFGTDFGPVRVHTDGSAARSARAIRARAYSSGADIVFASGRFTVATAEGRALLAHELAHVAQQGGDSGVVYRSPDDDTPSAPASQPTEELSKSWIGVNEIKWEHDHWTYLDESGVVWNYVVMYEDKPVTELESEWETEETRFDPWAFWLFKTDRVVHRGLRAVTHVEPTVTFEGWVPWTPEVISFTGSAPKEEKGWVARVEGWAEFALDWGVGPKKIVMIYRAYQLYSDVREHGVIQAGENYVIGAVENKKIDTALAVGKKVLKSSPKRASRHHDPAAKPKETKPRFHLAHKLTDAEKTTLRAEARKIAETARGGKRLAQAARFTIGCPWSSLTCSQTWTRTGSRTWL
jgi:Domain of unknown function (DUF4157)